MDENFIYTILFQTPGWVYFLFFALVLLGFYQRRSRIVSHTRLLILPLSMSGFSFYGLVASFGFNWLSVICWLSGFIVSIIFFRQLSIEKVKKLPSGKFEVKGSWWSLVLIMAIFFIRYFIGYAQAINHVILQQSEFIVTVSFLLGLLSGVFVALIAAGFSLRRVGADH
ncbi:DUF6622 family protein [Cellvibrio polysaccharolyticus]|uniref:DUF1453 domain-containing protein n=1 Tax=Cellvibrio polysaccharolyticus TaxID=2082724 RepID=A0A928YX88_9GAMM|nr:DUF6622 family protein [Cellvibrio polysaccharolyticus]MBE8719098.1 hypothetical protein [Cellvibrio polysaccharolyticus]